MPAVDDILSQLSISDLASRLGVSEGQAEEAVRGAVPALLGGMQANAQDPSGAAALTRALGQHGGEGFDLSHVDTADGEKIVAHVFGENQADVVGRLDDQSAGGLMSKLLPMLAPIVLGYLADKLGGGDSQQGGGGLGDLLGGLTGGSGGSDIGDMLGGLLGGADGGSGGLDVGDMLGDLLGGGSKG